ncbi:MAG TPA: alpha/beta fold hydrolase [Solirubrobacteraceae bacterium]|nr:alpha/beta fold hydrolase [Solirubrobacteraceae bacterium]
MSAPAPGHADRLSQPPPPRHDQVTVGDVDLRVLRAGDAGDFVVFVHGNPGSADDWAGPMAAIAGFAQAVAFDLPDFGTTSAPPDFDHSVAAYADFIQHALRVLGIQRTHLVLHDFGGPIGLAWAAAHPNAVASVTLIDTGVLPDYRWHPLARLWRTPIAGEIFQASATRPTFRWLINFQEPRPLRRTFLDRMYDHFDRRTRRAVLRLYRATDDPSEMTRELIGRLRPLDLPALVIWGEHDAYLPASYAARQRDAFPDAEVHVLAGSGHWPFIDAAPTVDRLLTDFLRPAREPDSAPE